MLFVDKILRTVLQVNLTLTLMFEPIQLHIDDIRVIRYESTYLTGNIKRYRNLRYLTIEPSILTHDLMRRVSHATMCGVQLFYIVRRYCIALDNRVA